MSEANIYIYQAKSSISSMKESTSLNSHTKDLPPKKSSYILFIFLSLYMLLESPWCFIGKQKKGCFQSFCCCAGPSKKHLHKPCKCNYLVYTPLSLEIHLHACFIMFKKKLKVFSTRTMPVHYFIFPWNMFNEILLAYSFTSCGCGYWYLSPLLENEHAILELFQ